MRAEILPRPQLAERACKGIPILTDDALADACGVRIAFSGRAGGVSKPPYDALNLGSHVGDDLQAVERNRARLCNALGADPTRLVVPNQVHGTDFVTIEKEDDDAIVAAREQASSGADAIVVTCEHVAALLCYADCVPVIVVSPSGAFVVAHAGWRGAAAHIASMAVRALVEVDERRLGIKGAAVKELAARMNAYIGPCIHRECFEVGDEVRSRFAAEFGDDCLYGARNVDLPAAVAADLARAGVPRERIADVGACTMCSSERFFSYRASGGVCGRHGAFAFRRE